MAGRRVRRLGRGRRGRLLVVRALAAERPAGGLGGRARRAGRRRTARVRPGAEPGRHHGHRAAHRLRPGRRARIRGRGAGRTDLEHLARPGAVDGVADGGLGLVGLGGAWLATGHPPSPRPAWPRDRLRRRRVRLRGAPRPLGHGHVRRRAVPRSLPGALGPRAAVQRRPRRRQLRDRARGRARAGADDLALPHPPRVHLAAGGGPPRDPARSGGRGVGGLGAAGPAPPRARRPPAGSPEPRTPTAASPRSRASPRARR